MKHYQHPLPNPTTVSKPFWDSLKQHQAKMQQCNQCQQFIFYPRTNCNYCMSDQLQWIVLKGTGRLYTFTIAYMPTFPTFAEDVPYNIAIVALDEGPHLATQIINCTNDDLHIGMPVRAVYSDVTEEVTLLHFEPK